MVHNGPYYRLDGPHLSDPLPQRVPVLFNAGVSPTGRAFAGRYAEFLFINSQDAAEAAPLVADVRRAAAAARQEPRARQGFSCPSRTCSPVPRPRPPPARRAAGAPERGGEPGTRVGVRRARLRPRRPGRARR
ncbi:LLM class flavin-dependent oxidoreductase [Amycolatopsis sp. NPDC023774]|uniref:LLM class flavin-dependent oxidoreductase n=1 Tax=Amycolatopsis sp. NPDC023774 TaxID=3155015 RepID=UPI0033ECCCA2